MSCVKTGAKLYIRNYGIFTICDVYMVGDTLVFRYYPDHIKYVESDIDATHVIEMVPDSDIWFHRSDLGVTVVPQEYVTGWCV